MSTRDIDKEFFDNVDANGVEAYREDSVDVGLVDPDTVDRIHVWDPGVRESEGQTIRLLHDRAAIIPDHEKALTTGGIHIPAQAQDPSHNDGGIVHASEQWHTGVCIARGPGVREPNRGRRIDLDFEVGDRVIYHRASARGIRWHDGRLAVLVKAGGDATAGDAVAAVVLAEGGAA